jgi:hypothetical protein
MLIRKPPSTSANLEPTSIPSLMGSVPLSARRLERFALDYEVRRDQHVRYDSLFH